MNGEGYKVREREKNASRHQVNKWKKHGVLSQSMVSFLAVQFSFFESLNIEKMYVSSLPT